MRDSVEVSLWNAMEFVAKARENGKEVDPASAMKAVPVVIRAALAAAALAASDRPVNAKSVAEIAGYSRGTAHRNNKESLDAILAGMPTLTQAMLEDAREGSTRAELHAELQRRDKKISELRQDIASLKADREVALSYARDLHQQLAPEFHGILAEKQEKVRKLRPVEPKEP